MVVKRGSYYRNLKNKNLYQVMNIYKHSETLELMVAYMCVDADSDMGWVRPLNLFVEKFEEVEISPVAVTYDNMR